MINQGDSISSATCQWDYGLFLSFREEDIYDGFASHIYEALCEKGVKTFTVDEIQRGDWISIELYKAIKFSMISIIIFSQNYTFLTWWFEEFVKILNWKQNR